ncbi:MAG: ABC transporter permease [Oscillospiraceae bacterium]|jgi:ribose/xylose/arabinose/galactoside ABC-type transport system permease subunit
MTGLKNNRIIKYLKDNNIIVILILIVIAAVLTASPKFTKATNLFNLSASIGTYGILAIGLGFVFLVGGIDLSVGYQVGFCGTVMALLTTSIGVWPAIVITLICGALIGYLNGTIVTRLKIPSLIGTLAVMTTLKGFVLLLNDNTGGHSISSAKIFGVGPSTFYSTKIFGFLAPSVLVAVVLLVFFAFFLRYTRSGSNLYVVGGNPEAGALSGINNNALIRFSYVICGLCASLCAVFSVSRLDTSVYNLGDNLDITAICALVIGGVKMQGGKGNMGMVIMGVAVIQIINNVMTKLGLQSATQALVTGVVVVLVLIIDRFTAEKAKA